MLTEEIANFIVEISYEQLPAAVINAGKIAILDCVGVTLAAGEETSGKIVSEYVRDVGRPEAGVIGEGFKTSVDQAAWVNGTKAHALDYDDYFTPAQLTPYHPTVAILPAVLAVGEKYHASGKEALLSYITGFEVLAKIAVACGKQHYEVGWHTTSNLGSIGAAAAIAKMLDLSQEKTRMALGIASSLAGGLRKNFGTMTKPLHAGNAARNGVVAAMLAQAGFTADKHILDSPLGFCEVLAGEVGYGMAKTTQEPRKEFYIVSPGMALKPYPSCAYTHWAIDATLELKRETVTDPNNIVEVECRTSSGLPRLLIHSHPATALEAKFSLEFCIAIALIEGEVSLKQFSDEKVKDSAVQELMEKINYVYPPEMGSGLVDLRGEVAVRLQNGKVYSHRVDIAKGAPKNPLNKDEINIKYRDCVRLALSPEDTDRSLDLISSLESVSNIVELMDILTFTSNQP